MRRQRNSPRELHGQKALELHIMPVLEVVMQEIASQRNNEESIVILNQKLEMLQLPLIQPNPRISIFGGNGFSPTIEGASIIDSKHKYCLPCKTGWNQYEFGILPVQVQQSNKNLKDQ